MLAIQDAHFACYQYREDDPPTLSSSHDIRYTSGGFIFYTLRGSLFAKMPQQTAAKCGSQLCCLLCGVAWALWKPRLKECTVQTHRFMTARTRSRRVRLFGLAYLDTQYKMLLPDFQDSGMPVL